MNLHKAYNGNMAQVRSIQYEITFIVCNFQQKYVALLNILVYSEALSILGYTMK